MVAAPFGGIVSLVPTSSDTVGGAGSHPRIIGADADARLTTGDALLAAPVGAPRADGRGDSRADREPAGSTPSPVEVRGRGS